MAIFDPYPTCQCHMQRTICDPHIPRVSPYDRLPIRCSRCGGAKPELHVSW